MSDLFKIDGKVIGAGAPTYMIAEIGINHNGSIDSAVQLIKLCHLAGFDAVKFQKRDPEISTPESQKSLRRETPWGEMSYLEYKQRIEFGEPEYFEIRRVCSELGITWFASPWDLPSAMFLETMDAPAFKIASASVTDFEVLDYVNSTGKPVILSTGMSTEDEIRKAVKRLSGSPLALMQATSSYPMQPSEANLSYMQKLRLIHNGPVGYSGHEPGLQVSLAAVAMGANLVERHVTLNRTMWGTDQAASLEPKGFNSLIRDIRIIESAIGDGVKRVYPSEIGPREKLRRVK